MINGTTVWHNFLLVDAVLSQNAIDHPDNRL
jgi:hypothetical protein